MTAHRGPFVLGTVQLGLDYGIANRTGRPNEREAFAILDAAYATGVTMLDTAHAYGAAERVIGNWLRTSPARPAVITKIPALKGGGRAVAEAAFSESLGRLDTERVHALLLHRGSDWHAGSVADWLGAMRANGKAALIGVSVYDADDIPNDDRIDIVQLPANAFSQQALSSPHLSKLLARGGMVHVRSVFAQGALLADPAMLPASLAAARPHLAAFRALAVHHHVHPAALAISAVRRLLPQCEIVLGAETVAQVEELASAAKAPVPHEVADAALALGRSAPGGLLDPRTWQQSTATAAPS